MDTSVIQGFDPEQVRIFQEQGKIRAEEKAKRAAEQSEFAKILNEQTEAISNQNTSICSPAELESYFDEASNTYGVSKDLLKSIAKAESNFNPSAVSSAGAVGIMQLMPATAASLGVTNSYDAYQNIMGGAKYISSLLSKYNGDTSLALAAYNAGSGNVEKYSGIPPFAETQNYVKKVLAGIGQNITIPTTNTNVFRLSGEERTEANQMLSSFFDYHNITKDSLDLMVALLKLQKVDFSNEAD